MAPRSDEPRRDAHGHRRGSSRAGVDRDEEGRDTGRDAGRDGRSQGGRRGLTGISDARAYTPRGRTIREAPELRTRRNRSDGGDPLAAGDPPGGRTGRSRSAIADVGDIGGRQSRAQRSAQPVRPALRVLDGGRPAQAGPVRATGVTRTREDHGAGRVAGANRGAAGRSGRGADVVKPVPAPRRRPTATRGGAARRPAASTGRGPAPRRRPTRAPRPPKLADPRRRLRLGTFLALAVFATIGIRLVALQVVDANGGLHERLQKVTLPAPRGAIYDRSGAALAHSVEARYVYADPFLVDDPAATAAALSPLLGIPRSKLTKAMQKRTRPDGNESRFEWLARGVDVETAEKIVKLKLRGIGVDHDERREVPGRDLAANLIGFVGDGMVGLEGIEARYDELLRGVDGEREFEIGRGDLAKAIPGGYSREKAAHPGSSLVLTIDRDLQYEVQRVLSTLLREAHGSTGAAIVLDVLTGEVLAQASHPTYNAANPLDAKPADRDDAATSFVVDPGSVHKPIVFGAALEEGVIAPDTTMPVPSTIRKADTVFADTHPANGRTMSLPGMLAYSSNAGTITIADQLGAQKLYDYQRKFGLGQATEVGLPGEASGRVLPPTEWSGSSYGSIPIGHSVDVTPLQMAAVYAAIANDGKWVQPHLIKEVVAPDGTRTPAAAPRTRQVISPENAAALRVMLEAVTTVPRATGLKAAIPGYRVAGKTGTGKRLVDGEYVAGEVASFIGMAPADNPRYVVAVFAHTPHGGGGDVTAPAFRDMMTFTLTHYRVPPTGTEPPDFVVFP